MGVLTETGVLETRSGASLGSGMTGKVHVIGGGLAGSEAAWQLAQTGVPVALHEMRPLRQDIQVIFQDPYGSLNPRRRVGSIIGDPFVIHGIGSMVTPSGRAPASSGGGRPCCWRSSQSWAILVLGDEGVKVEVRW